MRCYRLEKAGSLDGLVQGEAPKPAPRAGEVLVRVRATALNFRDRMLVIGQHPLPARSGVAPLSDASGEIEAVGDGVTRFAVGDRVISSFFPTWFGGPPSPTPERYGSDVDGWLLEYRVVAADALVHAPRSMTFEEAATLPVAGLTAWSALAGVGPSDTVLVQGTGGVSLFALQLARILGACVLATTSRAANIGRLKELGAEAVVDYVANPDWPVVVRELTAGRGPDRIVDVGGPGTLAKSINAVAHGGQVAIVGALAHTPAPFDFWSMFTRQATLRCISIGSRADLEALVRVVDAHSLHPVIDRIFPFDDAKAAFTHYFEGAPVGKVVIRH